MLIITSLALGACSLDASKMKNTVENTRCSTDSDCLKVGCQCMTQGEFDNYVEESNKRAKETGAYSDECKPEIPFKCICKKNVCNQVPMPYPMLEKDYSKYMFAEIWTELEGTNLIMEMDNGNAVFYKEEKKAKDIIYHSNPQKNQNQEGGWFEIRVLDFESEYYIYRYSDAGYGPFYGPFNKGDEI